KQQTAYDIPHQSQLPNAWITSYLVTICKLPASSLLRTAPFSLLMSVLSFSIGVSNSTTGNAFSITLSTVSVLISGLLNTFWNRPPSLIEPMGPFPFVTGMCSISYSLMSSTASDTVCEGAMVMVRCLPLAFTISLNV